MKQGELPIGADEQAAEFTALVTALSRPAAFPLAIHQPITSIQTHASLVLLAGERVYKLKKPKNFGFFDYSTPEQRRHFCLEEVRLNARLASDVYLGVAPVLASSGKQPRFGPVCGPEQLPDVGALFQGQSVIDFAVVMVRLPSEATLQALLRNHEADPALLSEIARKIADFHRSTPTTAEIARYGSPEIICDNWEENLEQMRPYIGRVLDASTWDAVAAYARDFMSRRRRLFAARVRDGRIRDCHGDLRLQHVYCQPRTADDNSRGSSMARPRIDIIDCIEFNERFRYGDVAGEVAFLAMELDEAKRPDLTQAFIAAYVAATGDEALPELLPFYCCYRACVRGKVTAFELDESEVPPAQKESARQRARGLFDLAASYARSPASPTLLMIGGVMGSGKSTLAAGVGQALGWKVITSDIVRKRLAGVAADEPQPYAFGAGIYATSWNARTYSALLQEAAKVLSDDRSIILDASFSDRKYRQAATTLAAGTGVKPIFAECRCPRDVARERLAGRWQARNQPDRPLEREGPEREEPALIVRSGSRETMASDGRPDLYDAQLATWQRVTRAEAKVMQHVVILTSGEPESAVEKLIKTLA
ncbi:MAG: AAA family ATPase [Ktedonobacterales bacterium]